VVVGPASGEAHQLVQRPVVSGEPPELVDDLLLGESCRKVQRLGEPQIRWDRLEQVVD